MNSLPKDLQKLSGFINITGETLQAVRNKTKGDVAEIMSLTSYHDEQYEYLMSNTFDGKSIKSLIKEYPYIWQNIKFKFKDYIKKLKKKDGKEDNDLARRILIDEIVKIFMKPSKNNFFLKKEKKEILMIIEKEIVDNDSLSTYVDGHSINSFIEYSNAKLKNLSERKDWGGFGLLIKNISGRTLKKGESEIRHFNKIFKEVIDYANHIFHIDIYTSLPLLKNIKGFEDFDMIGEMLRDAMEAGGTSYRDASFFIKALYAWSDIPSIKQTYEEALTAQGDFFYFLNSPEGKCTERLLSKPGKISRVASGENIQREFIYNFLCTNGDMKNIKITTRVKKVESILIKLFADEHYGSIDAINDLLGIRMFLGDLNEKEKIEVIHFFGKFMGKNSAIFKNKGYLDNRQLSLLMEKWKALNSEPIGIESRKKMRNSNEYKDCKYSGYLREDVHKKQMGTEIQFFDNNNEPNPKGKAHHSILDTKKILQGWYRGAHIITGKQIGEAIGRRCFRKDNSGLTFTEIFKEICVILIPYIRSELSPANTAEMAFAVKGYEELIRDEFPSMRPLRDSNKLLSEYGLELEKECRKYAS